MRITSKEVVLTVVLLSATLPALAAPGWLIGFGVGVTIQIIPFTRNHIIMPPLKLAQRTIRPMPQDKIDKANKKAEKVRRKAMKQRQENHSEGVTNEL